MRQKIFQNRFINTVLVLLLILSGSIIGAYDQNLPETNNINRWSSQTNPECIRPTPCGLACEWNQLPSDFACVTPTARPICPEPVPCIGRACQTDPSSTNTICVTPQVGPMPEPTPCGLACDIETEDIFLPDGNQFPQNPDTACIGLACDIEIEDIFLPDGNQFPQNPDTVCMDMTCLPYFSSTTSPNQGDFESNYQYDWRTNP